MIGRRKRPGRVHDRVNRLEAETGIDKGRPVTVFADDFGHTEYPMGKPRRGDTVTEIHLGGIDLEEDL